MRSLVAQFLYYISSCNFTQLDGLLEDNCLFVNYDKTILGKQKIMSYLKDQLENYNINHISILNSVQDSKDTLLISYHIIIDDETIPVYGSAVVRIIDKRIHYIKNFIVK